jgi:hypothetical protein
VHYVLNVYISWGLVRNAVLTFGYNFPSLLPLIAILGVTRRARRGERLFLYSVFAQTIIILLFVGRYTIRDQYTFFVPVCACMAFWFGYGADRVLRNPPRWLGRGGMAFVLIVNAALPVALYFAFPTVAEQRGWFRDRMRDLPYRNEYRHFFRPWKRNDHSAERFADDILWRVGAHGWLFGDTLTGFCTANYYMQNPDPPGIRIFHGDLCLNQRGLPPLTVDDLKQHLREGGRVLAVSEVCARGLMDDDERLVAEGPYWRIELRTPTSASSSQSDAP